MHLPESLTHKLGPLPVWAWGLIGGVGVALVLRSRGAGKSSTSAGGSSTLVPGQFDTGGSFGGGGGGGGGDQGVGSLGGSDGGSAGAGTFLDPAPIFDPAFLLPGQVASAPTSTVMPSTPESAQSSSVFAPSPDPYATYTATELQDVVKSTGGGQFAASPNPPFAVAGTAASPGGYSASDTQGVFAVDLGHMDYPASAPAPTGIAAYENPPGPHASPAVQQATADAASAYLKSITAGVNLGYDPTGGYGEPVVGGVLDPGVDYAAPAFHGSDVVPTNPDTGYAYGDAGAL